VLPERIVETVKTGLYQCLLAFEIPGQMLGRIIYRCLDGSLAALGKTLHLFLQIGHFLLTDGNGAFTVIQGCRALLEITFEAAAVEGNFLSSLVF
jgi:hypothetical protein